MSSTAYIFLLTRLVAATQQDHQHARSYRVVHSVTLADMDPQLADSATDCSMVPKVALLDPIDTNGDSRSGALVAQALQPAKKGIALDYLRSTGMYPKGDGVRQAPTR